MRSSAIQQAKPGFCGRFIESCQKHEAKVGMRIVGVPGSDVTFGELLRQVRAVSYRLKNTGIGKGDRISVIGENHPSWAISYLAALYSAAVCVPLDPHGETSTLTNFIVDSETKVIFCDGEAFERVRTIVDGLESEIPIVVWETEKDTEASLARGALSFSDWTGSEFPGEFGDAPPPAKPEDDAVLIYTSGTTGKPKGVLLTHFNINAELDAIDGVLEFTERESVLSLLPLFHVYLQIVNLWLASTKGAMVFYLRELSPDELSRGMLESKMTILTSVPRLWYLFHKKIFDAIDEKPAIVRILVRGLLRLNGFTRDYLNINLGRKLFKQVHDSFGGNLELAVTAGSRFDEAVAIDFHRLGFTIVQGYGLSETSGAATGTYVDDNRVGSVGKPMGDAEVKIDNPDENGEGEVLIRGSMVFKGYDKNPEATSEAFTSDGWFKSGDLGKFDQDGHLYITGRKKDVIVLPSGKNVHPEDLEVHYLKSPLVEEMCVIGVPDENSDHAGAEKLVGVVIPDFEYMGRSSIANSGEAIRFELDNLGRDLPEYQRVRDYVVRSEPLPRTATRKIKRFELKKELETGIANGRGETKTWDFSEQDRETLDSGAGKALVSLINAQTSEPREIHPDMNLEIDLRLDSLSRAEIVAGLEQAFGFEFGEEEITRAYKFREVVGLVEKHVPESKSQELLDPSFNWSEILSEQSEPIPETKRVLRRKHIFEPFAFVGLKIANLLYRVFFRLEVTGSENLKEIESPFLICPNHQSYIDPLVVCSTYPYAVLRDTFHVGASEYFQNFFMRIIGSVLKIVPIDPDTQLIKAMRAGAVGLNAGKILNIYPEGERAFDGNLHKFKNGAAILSKELGLPIIPVAIDGLHKVWGRGSLKIRAAKVKIEFCEPLIPSENDDYEEITAKLKETIRTRLEQMRDN
ncbi:MAG: AMP-binding protein [Pyrinomonadaceae bacterium]|nr:AMP-binding protein [Pyrinomonadaceae bacterium]